MTVETSAPGVLVFQSQTLIRHQNHSVKQHIDIRATGCCNLWLSQRRHALLKLVKTIITALKRLSNFLKQLGTVVPSKHYSNGHGLIRTGCSSEHLQPDGERKTEIKINCTTRIHHYQGAFQPLQLQIH